MPLPFCGRRYAFRVSVEEIPDDLRQISPGVGIEIRVVRRQLVTGSGSQLNLIVVITVKPSDQSVKHDFGSRVTVAGFFHRDLRRRSELVPDRGAATERSFCDLSAIQRRGSCPVAEDLIR